MEIRTTILEKNIMVVEIIGEVDAYTSQNFQSILADLMEGGHHRIVLDVSKVTFISSAGIREFLLAYKNAVQTGGEIRITRPTERVRRIFEISGLFELMHITDKFQDTLQDWG
jgi:anti-sigma B factor antagonist